MEFFYDNMGVFATKFDNATYYYRKDLQGNIVELLDNTGAVVVKYRYDAWGKCVVDASTTNTTLANLNPFRYRGYYFDTETNLYYLQSRYYDPEIGRFITIDDISYLDPETINGLNLYAYCGNNPVMEVDPNGCAPAWWQWALSGLALIGGIALCFVPGAQALGVGLIVAGASSMASNIMSAAGVDGKTAALISNGLNIVAGAVLLATPFAAIGASMIGSGIGGVAGGFISEHFGGSFELGSTIGNIVGGIAGGQIYKGLVNHGIISFKVQASKLEYNPADPFSNPSVGPKQGEVVNKIQQIQQTGRYDEIMVSKLSNGMFQVENGHHTLRALISLGYKFVKVKLI